MCPLSSGHRKVSGENIRPSLAIPYQTQVINHIISFKYWMKS